MGPHYIKQRSKKVNTNPIVASFPSETVYSIRSFMYIRPSDLTTHHDLVDLLAPQHFFVVDATPRRVAYIACIALL